MPVRRPTLIPLMRPFFIASFPLRLRPPVRRRHQQGTRSRTRTRIEAGLRGRSPLADAPGGGAALTVLPRQTPEPRPLSDDQRAALEKPFEAGPRCLTGKMVYDPVSKFYVPETRKGCVAAEVKSVRKPYRVNSSCPLRYSLELARAGAIPQCTCRATCVGVGVVRYFCVAGSRVRSSAITSSARAVFSPKSTKALWSDFKWRTLSGCLFMNWSVASGRIWGRVFSCRHEGHSSA